MSSDAPRLQSDTPSALPPGTRLGEFELLSLLGVGGFGIVYLAFDHALEREVAVKEYMPASLAGRTETMHVSLRSQSDADTFALGLKSFVNEARLLARFDHPSLLKVHRFWEANGTAYMAMPVLRGQTVKEVRAAMTAPPTEAWLRSVLEPLLGAIDRLHAEGVYHRDIAPDNVQIEPGGHPVLLDFGAARRVIGDRTQTLTAILKPAYAPIEQYAEVGAVKQGPWTDLYSLGATLHFLLLGRPPSPATARAVHDEASALTVEACPGCSDNFLLAVDWMLSPRPIDRPQSVAALREVLNGSVQPPQRRAGDAAPVSQWAAGSATVLVRPAPPVQAVTPDVDLDAMQALPPPAPEAEPEPLPLPVFAAPPVSASLDAPAPAAGQRKPLWLALACVAAVVLGAVLFWPRTAAVPTVDAAASAASAASAAAAAAAASAALPPVPELAASAVPESAITTVVVPEPAARPPAATATRPNARTPVAAAAPAPMPAPSTPAPAPEAQAVVPAPAPVVAAPVEAPKPVPAPAPPGPEAICAGRNALMNFVCMERECLRAQFGAHADCQKWRKDAKRE